MPAKSEDIDMDREVERIEIEIKNRTMNEVADDLEDIAKAMRQGGVFNLPSRLVIGPRAISINVLTKD